MVNNHAAAKIFQLHYSDSPTTFSVLQHCVTESIRCTVVMFWVAIHNWPICLICIIVQILGKGYVYY